MGDLIKREDAVYAMAGFMSLRTRTTTSESYVNTASMVMSRIPSAQPDCIRCKDCKHYKFSDNRAFGFPVKRCEWTGFEDVDDDDFCSRAERRE